MWDLPLIVWYFQGLLTPVIAVTAVYIAYQQLQANAQKLKLDLFDRRFSVFDETRKVLGRMYTSGVKDEDLLKFLSGVVEARFLFGPEIREYHQEIDRRIQILSFAKRQMNEALEGGASVEERTKLAETEKNEVEWATAQTGILSEKFNKYLDVSKL
jgi:hypothetical protein